ncbi:MAG: BadF/BadG/BcrA/BcrD ATPase family protein [Terracidiphilus sp.]|nr:BadF/BadG/BcrA/BcrD ATPase family protein [Terracidiphilus sp.]MDR3775709.1 BadF/BadG/BcrA/BcrD ATPase family protein [Terracidiphilus sp.]
MDVGSTTVKTTVRTADTGEILLQDYRRHESRQAETVLGALLHAKRELFISDECMRLFMTGSGGQKLAHLLGARFVQEVAAVSLAVENSYPDVRSVIELGGQDAKIIVFQEGSVQGRRKKIASMNDKCAGGTGVVIEKIAAKLHIPTEDLLNERYDGLEIYPIAGKCGVFAETDITGLQKQGVPVAQLMASLFHAIVLQNLSVLTRGHTLLPKVFLLGGPNAYFPGLQSAWRKGLLDLWKRKNTPLPEGALPEELVVVPPMAEFFAAIGAIEFGAAESEGMVPYQGTQPLESYIREENATHEHASGVSGLCGSQTELVSLLRTYAQPAPAVSVLRGTELGVFIGLDGGSTSTKAVALSTHGEVLATAYMLSQADPVADTVSVLRNLRGKLELSTPCVKVMGVGTTGYSKDLLKKVLSADIALVETVAHAKSSLRLFPNVDAIIDVGGQDIKIIVLQDGAVKDFKLNTQCSAGNGYFLQAAAEGIGIQVENFADVAFTARRVPQFSYGCAVFLQSDIVNFQRQGWTPEEILAGLANVLPKNVFLYVAGVSNVATLGRRFVLQGGTQRNLAVVKAEVDFIRTHYHGSERPEVVVHPNCCEAGAIGAALEAMEHCQSGHVTVFPGFDLLDALRYTIRRDETTRCHFCANRCLRTFVELNSATTNASDLKRAIIATCDRGEANDTTAAKGISAFWTALRQRCPNYVQLAGEQAWLPMHPASAIASSPQMKILSFTHRIHAKQQRRARVQIGIPKALNLFTYAPLFSAYFESLGIPAGNLHYSHFSSAERYQEAAGFSAIDPCFPSKVSVAHVYELLQRAKKDPMDAIFFPMFDVLTTTLESCSGSCACPSGSATPEAVKAAFSRTVDWFREAGVTYVNPVLDMADRGLFKYQMFSCWREMLDLGWQENSRAVDIAYRSWETFEARFRLQARVTLEELERSGNVGLVMLGRPYHHDPGLNQGILEELQRLGYPIFSQSLLPLDPDVLDRLFGAEVDAGLIDSPLDISDVWKHTFSASSNHKLWAAKFVARHPNLISVELSNFKCGHDAFISRIIEQIVEQSGKPHFSFRDLDENRPLASIRIRIETMDYFLKRYRNQLRGVPERPFDLAHKSHFTSEPAHIACAPIQGQSLT